MDHPRGGYRFLTGIAPYSCGVASLPDHEIVHVTLRRPMPYVFGFDRIERFLSEVSRPRHALCGVELRLPGPLSFDGFAAFNARYQQLLDDLGLLIDGCNPVARTNVAPAVDPPAEPALYGFSYTAPCTDADGLRTFVVAGAGDLMDQANLSAAAVVRPDEVSDDAMREKAGTVMRVMHSRMEGLGVGWGHVTTVDVYTERAVEPLLRDLILEPIGEAAAHGVHWHYSRPPIADLAFEMDVRGVARELWI